MDVWLDLLKISERLPKNLTLAEHPPVNTRRCLDVDSASFERHGRHWTLWTSEQRCVLTGSLKISKYYIKKFKIRSRKIFWISLKHCSYKQNMFFDNSIYQRKFYNILNAILINHTVIGFEVFLNQIKKSFISF